MISHQKMKKKDGARKNEKKKRERTVYFNIGLLFPQIDTGITFELIQVLL